MTDAEKKMKKYTNEIERRLNLPVEVKARVMSDFISSIAARREAGQKDEEIMAELGNPKKVAAELNEQMKEFACRKKPWRLVFLALAIWGGVKIFPSIWQSILLLGYDAWSKVSASHAASVGIIGGADGPTAIFVTSPGWVHYIVPVGMMIVGIFGYIKLRKPK